MLVIVRDKGDSGPPYIQVKVTEVQVVRVDGSDVNSRAGVWEAEAELAVDVGDGAVEKTVAIVSTELRRRGRWEKERTGRTGVSDLANERPSLPRPGREFRHEMILKMTKHTLAPDIFPVLPSRTESACDGAEEDQ